MDSVSPYPIGPGQRTLAAIVFTDVVSFSKLVHKEEVTTLELLERDFEVMRKLCEKHSGSVLKTTGDGLLFYFSSAVQAVGCAVKLQRQFAERARSHPLEGALMHRVGIHLGDVFVNNHDVMGDGVNIASRLQAEAEPGGICISQTVYDVVKNKLKLDVARLAPRNLRNIAEPVPIYRILLEPAKRHPSPVVPPVYSAPAKLPPARMTITRKLAAAGALGLVIGGVVWVVVRAQQKYRADLARSHATQAELGALLAAKGDDPLGKAADQAAPVVAGPDETSSAERIHELLGWMNGALQRYTKDSPLLLRELPGAISSEAKLFMDTDHRLYFAEGGAIRQRNLTDLKPVVLGAVITSVILDASEPPPRGVMQGAEAFADANGLPEMAEVLQGNAGRPQPQAAVRP